MGRLLPLAVIASLLPLSAFADIPPTGGGTVSGVGQDDLNTSTTFAAQYCPYGGAVLGDICAYMFSAANSAGNPGQNLLNTLTAQFGGNWVYAQQIGLAPVAAADLNITQYQPWVVNNNATTNFVTDPTGKKQNDGVTGQDAGGADIEITYTPTAGTDPTSVNFVQAYTDEQNPGNPFSNLTIDGATGLCKASFAYNCQGVSGTGNKSNFPPNPPNNNPLNAKNSTAWMVDIPFDSEAEKGKYNFMGCPPGDPDGFTCQETVDFETFIEGTATVKGTTYNVLYGGITWGYVYSNVDVPEASSFLTLGLMLSCLAGFIRSRHRGLARPA